MMVTKHYYNESHRICPTDKEEYTVIIADTDCDGYDNVFFHKKYR